MRPNSFLFTLFGSNVPMDKTELQDLRREMEEKYNKLCDSTNMSFMGKVVKNYFENPYFRFGLLLLYPFANKWLKSIMEDRPVAQDEDFDEDLFEDDED